MPIGIRFFPSIASTCLTSKLSFDFPATIAGPLAPPLSVLSFVSRRRFARCFAGPWQSRQVCWRMGWTSRWKSILPSAGNATGITTVLFGALGDGDDDPDPVAD